MSAIVGRILKDSRNVISIEENREISLYAFSGYIVHFVCIPNAPYCLCHNSISWKNEEQCIVHIVICS